MDEDYSGYESYDPYDSMPFGDAIRFEENCLASEANGEFVEEEDFFDENIDYEEWEEEEDYGCPCSF